MADKNEDSRSAEIVARRYGLHASQLFVWRQQLQLYPQQGEGLARAPEPILPSVLGYAAMLMEP